MALSSEMINNFFDAINVISKDNVEQSNRDITIDAEIVQLINADRGEYKVSYQGNTFSAESTDVTITYNPGDKVYVFVPQGDYSKKKLILGRSDYRNDGTYQDKQDMLNFYIDRGPNWLEWYGNPDMALNICAVNANDKEKLTKKPDAEDKGENAPAYYTDYGFARKVPEKVPHYIHYPVKELTDLEFNEFLNEADDQLQRYGKAWGDIKISASFQTRFSSIHNIGQYALRVTCVAANPKYIEDESHPDFEANHGQEYMGILKQKQEYEKTIDKDRYAVDEEYAKEVRSKLLEYNTQMEEASIEKRFQLLSFDLGFKSFNGAPYAFAVETPQKGYFNVGVGLLKGLYSIELLQDGNFIADIIPTYHDDGTISYEAANAVLDMNNIFCKDIDIRFCEKINLNETLYYPWIETPYGDALYKKDPKAGYPTGRMSVTLIAHLQHGYKDILTKDNCEVYWFREKSDVTSATFTEAEKDEHGFTPFDYSGPGWYPVDRLIETVEQIDDENKRMNYAVNFNELTIDISAVPYEWMYKAVIVYRDKGKPEQPMITMVEAEQLIKRLDSSYDLEIETVVENGGRDTLLRILNKKKNVHEVNKDTGENWPEWYGTWWLKLQDESYTMISDPYHRGLFKVNDFLLNDVMTFYVQAYDPEQVDPANKGEAYLQAPEITTLRKLIIAADEGDLHINWVGKDTFNYDALGTLKGWEADVDNTLTPEVSWAEGHGSDYIITIFGPDGVPLSNRNFYDQMNQNDTGQAGQAPNSMMKNIWVDFENTIHFQVEEQFLEDKAVPENNTFTLRMSCVNGKNFELKKTIYFTKDGAMGTQGSDWTATIRPCNWKYGPDKEEGPYIEAINYPNPLIVICDEQTQTMEQDKNFRLFLRPFVTKNGIPLEQLDPYEGYFYKIYWDVRMPGSARDGEEEKDQKIRYASFLRLYHANGNFASGSPAVGDIYKRDGTFYENGGMHVNSGYEVQYDNPTSHATDGLESKVSPNEKEKNGLIGFSLYPQHQYSEHPDEETGSKFKYENYGAVEVRFFDNFNLGTGATLEDLMYRFIVKAQVDIMKGQYDQKTKMIQVEGNTERIASITSYYPVDLIFNYDNLDFSDATSNPDIFEPFKKIATNWPRYVSYNASGYDPSCFDLALDFKYDSKGFAGKTTIPAWNLTPLTQSLETSIDQSTGKQVQRYRPKPHLNMTEGFHGVLRTYPGVKIFGDNYECSKTYFIRNQVMFLNAYGNVDINGWDGQGIDMNEERGTIFATTIGAGYKKPSTNAFTGVLMGADSSLPRSKLRGYKQTYDAELEKCAPYLTGLFGFQDGVKSFALLENGTGFFGRADRGGRIIFDGANAVIYGGGNGEMKCPSIKDDMWNSMRLTLMDLTHATYKEGENVGGIYPNEQRPDGDDISEENKPTEGEGEDQKTISTIGTSVGDYYPAGDGAYFGFIEDGQEYGGNYRYKLPIWYRTVWERAYIKPYGKKPYWLVGNAGSNPGDGSSLDILNTDAIYAQLPAWHKDIDETENSYRIDYFNKSPREYPGKETPETVWEDKQWDGQGQTTRLTGFGSSRASTTPAIEIGQHMPGLMPGLIPWCMYDKVFETLQIPADRNFMVTYDGTLWAMNGVFMGVLIGSNIVGGRLQGSEIGIGKAIDKDATCYVMMEHGRNKECEDDCSYPDQRYYNTTCDVRTLHAPWDFERRVVDNGTPGGEEEEDDDPLNPCKGSGGLGFYVDPNGNVVCNSIKIYGGSIDIGRFHILGKTSDDYGHLVQIAESDFIGPTHFYGNISITPLSNLNEFKDMKGNSSLKLRKKTQGNLFQGAGMVALGVPIWEDKSSDDFDVSSSWSAIIKDTKLQGTSTYYATGVKPNDPQIQKGKSLQQNSFFAIDHLDGGLPKEGDEDTCFKGHFWPLYFHYGYSDDKITDVNGKPVIPAYVTTMELFKQYSFKYSAKWNGTNPIDGANYFRIGPFGGETMMLWIRKSFQAEKSCTIPLAEKNGTSKDIYLAKFGINNRAGTPGSAADQNSIGIDTFYAAPIIVNSDGESAWTTRGHFHIWIKARSDNFKVGNSLDTWTGNSGESAGKRCFGVVMNFGSNITDDRGMNGNNAWLKTAGGPITIGVHKEDKIDESKNIFTPPTPGNLDHEAGLFIDPMGVASSQTPSPKAAMTMLWSRKCDLHLCRFKPGSTDHHMGKAHTEIWMSEEALRGTASDAISMLYDYPAHEQLKDGVGAKGFATDKNFSALLHTSNVTLSGNSTNFQKDRIRLSATEIFFEGTYADENHQHNIYARFA